MITRIEIEGVDKTGKNLIADYVDRLSNRRYILGSRGLLSMMVYSDIYKRNYDYTNELKDNKNTFIVLLTADKEDLEIRHKLSKEQKIDIDRDSKVFNDYLKVLDEHGIKHMTFNTSRLTPYTIANIILDIVEERDI